MESIAYSHCSIRSSPIVPVISFSFPSLNASGGIAGSLVLASLSFAPLAEAIVVQGDTCPAVTGIQNALTAANYSVGAIDGIFGGQTQAALIRFQIAKGLTGDGIVGPVTAQALGLDAKDTAYAIGTVCGNPGAASSTGTLSAEALQTYTVQAAALNVRSGPGTTFAVVDVLTQGSQIQGTPDSSGWIKLSADRWVAAEFVASGSGTVQEQSANVPSIAGDQVSISEVETVRVLVKSLNVRSGPGSDYEVVGIIVENDVVPLSGKTTEDGWIQLAWGDWIYSEFVESYQLTSDVFKVNPDSFKTN